MATKASLIANGMGLINRIIVAVDRTSIDAGGAGRTKDGEKQGADNPLKAGPIHLHVQSAIVGKFLGRRTAQCAGKRKEIARGFYGFLSHSRAKALALSYPVCV